MKMLILSYQGIRTRSFIQRNKDSLRSIRPHFSHYTEIVSQLKEMFKERKKLLSEKKELPPPLKIGEHRRLSQRIAMLTEDIEELESEKARILSDLHRADDSEVKEVEKWVQDMETELQKAETTALAEYHRLEDKTADFDKTDLWAACLELRPEKEKEPASKVQEAYGVKYDPAIMGIARE